MPDRQFLERVEAQRRAEMLEQYARQRGRDVYDDVQESERKGLTVKIAKSKSAPGKP